MVSLKPGPDGQRRRKKISGKNKTEVRAKLAELHDELNDGVVTNAARPRAFLPETARAGTASAAGSSPGTRDDHN